VKQSLLYFVAAGLCAASLVASTLFAHVTTWTVLVILLTAIVLGLGLRSRHAGN
jgi:hypothetical protein